MASHTGSHAFTTLEVSARRFARGRCRGRRCAWRNTLIEDERHLFSQDGIYGDPHQDEIRTPHRTDLAVRAAREWSGSKTQSVSVRDRPIKNERHDPLALRVDDLLNRDWRFMNREADI